jgi:hypothetical protein
MRENKEGKKRGKDGTESRGNYKEIRKVTETERLILSLIFLSLFRYGTNYGVYTNKQSKPRLARIRQAPEKQELMLGDKCMWGRRGREGTEDNKSR